MRASDRGDLRQPGQGLWAALIGAAACALASAPVPARADVDACAEAALGEGGAFQAVRGDDERVDGITLAFQCAVVLDDGRLVPRGYRLDLTGACGDLACQYPTILLMETARAEVLRGFFVDDGRNVDVLVRAEPVEGEARLIMTAREPGGNTRPERPAPPRPDATSPQSVTVNGANRPTLARSKHYIMRRIDR